MWPVDALKYVFRTGKNSRFPYILRNLVRYYIEPNAYFRRRRERLLAALEQRDDKAYILDRVNYYCKLSEPVLLSDEAKRVGDFRRKGHGSVYFFDSYEFVRYFPVRLRWKYLFGDIRAVQAEPTIVKSRPLGVDNRNSVLLNLEKIRHFIALKDRLSFKQKINKAIFRGEISGKPHRIAFFERWFGHPCCDIGEFGRRYTNPAWRGTKLTLYEHLRYKFIISLEGNDVASNLKWIMSSDSLAIMPRPTCETWYMEGKLLPNVHYVEIQSDYSDLEERMNYYTNHPDEAETIIRNAQAWRAQFNDKQRERLISLLVLDKYFRMTEQEDLL
ncbi:MAG: lipopolysaccharide biosynthesis protein [Prevotellaceae bacterium]|jgi:hypothetical protein|nr:lipopolysaccharide biosynthesis protein [Prevotellaceae bacterium]